MMKPKLEVTLQDLSFLYTAKMKWDEDFATQIPRFESVNGDAINNNFRNAYWLPDWISVMIFRTYFNSVDSEFQILIDNADGIDPYVVLCGWEL
jgi:hypothetical protein